MPNDILAAPVPNPPPNRARLVGIQYLRALAALSVLAFHSIGSPETTIFGVLSAGVDLFFVISGFIMVLITDSHSKPRAFLIDRFVRIVPLYWIATAAMIAVIWSRIAWTPPMTAWHNIASFLFIPAASPYDGRVLPVLPAGWTLFFEMRFYAIFALLLLLPERWRVPGLSIALVALVLAGFLSPTHPLSLAVTHPINLEFVAGAWLGVAWRKGINPFAALALIVLAAVPFLLVPAKESGIGRLYLMIVASALLASVLWLERKPGGIVELRALRLIGDASYSIYLTQIFTMMFWSVAGAYLRYGLHRRSALIFLTGVPLGVAIYFMVERPLLRYFRERRANRRATDTPGSPAVV